MPIEANRCGNRPFILCMASCGDRDGGLAQSGALGEAGGSGSAAKGGGGACLEAVVPEARGFEDNVVGLWRGQKAAAVLPRSRRLRAVSTISEPRVLGLPTCAARAGAGGGSSGRD